MADNARWSRHLVILCAGAAAWGLPALADSTPTTRPAEQDRTEAVMGTLGTYNAPPRLQDGHVDARRLLDDLTELKANTYHWLIWHAASDWDDLQRFLPMARARGIRVWVSLVPPSESPPHAKNYSEPFKLDYDEWARQIGRLSGREPNLVAWSIDDFAHNLDVFTAEKTQTMVELARAGNPKLAFVPCVYFRQVNPRFAKSYRGFLDGILFPYRHESVGTNLTDASSVEAEVRRLRELFGPRVPIFVDVYATAHSKLGDSTPEYVRQVIDASAQCADGVLIYCHQDRDKRAAKFEAIKAGFQQWLKAGPRPPATREK